MKFENSLLYYKYSTFGTNGLKFILLVLIRYIYAFLQVDYHSSAETLCSSHYLIDVLCHNLDMDQLKKVVDELCGQDVISEGKELC